MAFIKKNIELNNIRIKIKFEVLKEHKLNPPIEFTYKIKLIPKHPITKNKINRLIGIFDLKIVGVWSSDVFEHTSHKLGYKETIEKREYIYKGELVKYLKIKYITNSIKT